MKKYALLVVLLCCFASCTTDDLDDAVQEINLNDLSQDDSNETDWDKRKLQ